MRAREMTGKAKILVGVGTMALALMTQPALAQPYPTAAPTSFAMPSSGYTVADLDDAPASESEFTLTMLAAGNVGNSELDRKSGVWGKRGLFSVDFGGRRIIKKKIR